MLKIKKAKFRDKVTMLVDLNNQSLLQWSRECLKTFSSIEIKYKTKIRVH